MTDIIEFLIVAALGVGTVHVGYKQPVKDDKSGFSRKKESERTNIMLGGGALIVFAVGWLIYKLFVVS